MKLESAIFYLTLLIIGSVLTVKYESTLAATISTIILFILLAGAADNISKWINK